MRYSYSFNWSPFSLFAQAEACSFDSDSCGTEAKQGVHSACFTCCTCVGQEQGVEDARPSCPETHRMVVSRYVFAEAPSG